MNYDRSIHFNSFDHPIKLVTISFGISHTKLIAKRGSIDDLQDPKHLAELTVLFLQISYHVRFELYERAHLAHWVV